MQSIRKLVRADLITNNDLIEWNYKKYLQTFWDSGNGSSINVYLKMHFQFTPSN
jgi:hypothetical protein